MIRNTNESWGWPARTLHWLIAVLLLAQIALGIWADEAPDAVQRYYIGLHASLGVSILALMVVRLAWRLMNASPSPPPGTPAWQRSAASFVHGALYVVTFATVFAGWLLVGSHETPIEPKMFGLVPMPQLIAPKSPLHDLLGEVHETLAFTLVGLIIVHVAAAVYHHAILRDDVMRRMTSGAAKATNA